MNFQKKFHLNKIKRIIKWKNPDFLRVLLATIQSLSRIKYEQRFIKSLLKDNRIDDLKRALDDPTFHQKLLEEYGID